MALRPQPERLDLISLCTGGGGLDLAVELAVPRARTVLMVEREAFAVAHLVAAMEQGVLDPAAIWSDVRTFDGRRFRGLVDGVIGGIPCQPYSLSGLRKGGEDERDLWPSARRIIVQARPWMVLIENVLGMLTPGDDEVAGAERVLGGLHRLGFEVEAGLFTAEEVGVPQVRPRLFILGVADAGRERLEGTEWAGSHDEWDGPQASRSASQLREVRLFPPAPHEDFEWRGIFERYPHLEPEVCRLADGLAATQPDWLRLLGNGVVPLEGAYALRTLATRLAGRGSAGAACLVRMMVTS